MNILLSIRNFLDYILTKMVRSRITSRWIILSIDLFIAMITIFFSYNICVFLYPGVINNLPKPFDLYILYFCLIYLSFIFFKTHIGIVRYSSYYEVWRIFMAVSFATLILTSFVFIFGYNFPISLTGLLINFTTLILSLIALRYLIVILYRRLTKNSGEKTQRAMVFEASHDSVALARSLLIDKNSRLKVVGFLTTDPLLKEKRIMDLPVLHIDDRFGRLVAGFEFDTIIFPNKDFLSKEHEGFIKRCMELKIKVLISQAPHDLSEEINHPTKIRNVQIEDLLGRDEILISLDEISKQVNDKVILVTGAAGSIGSELVRQLTLFKPRLLILFDIAETPLHNLKLEMDDQYSHVPYKTIIGDVRNYEKVSNIFKTYKPNIVYHAAAYKHVPLMEESPCEAINVNVYGTINLANISIRNLVEKFVMISTDKAVNPSNVMGASKRIAEIYVQSLAKYIEKKKWKNRFVTTRFGNVLGSNGSVIPRFKQQIENGGPLTVTDPNITRFFMTIPEACRLVLEAGTMGKNGEIYVFDMGEPVKIDDLARRMIQLAGFVPDKDIQIVYSGLRPGEKLYEELLNDCEHTKPTQHAKIMIADVREYELKKVINNLNNLVNSAKKMDDSLTVKIMKELVPEFLSNNSEFEIFDKK